MVVLPHGRMGVTQSYIKTAHLTKMCPNTVRERCCSFGELAVQAKLLLHTIWMLFATVAAALKSLSLAALLF